MPLLANLAALLRSTEQPIGNATTSSPFVDRSFLRNLPSPYPKPELPKPIVKEPTMTEKTINAALDSVGAIEGGYVNDPADRGGETNHGVTLKFLQQVKPGSTSDDLKKLTKDDARKLFDKHFVRDPGLDKLPDVVQAEAVALAINAGATRAIKVLQKAAGVEQDGHLGPATLAALEHVDNDTIKQAVDSYYIDLVRRKPDQAKFLKGWLNRSARISAIPEDADEEPVQVLKGDDGKLYTQEPDGSLKEYNG